MEGEVTVRREGSFVGFTREIDGKQLVTPCRDIRGSLVWSTIHSPSYYCIFAQENQINPQGKLPLVLLVEYTEALPQKFLQEIVKAARKMSCRIFYSDYRKENRQLLSLFSDFCWHQRITYIDLKRAPLAENYSIGMALIKEWSETLEVPEGRVIS